MNLSRFNSPQAEPNLGIMTVLRSGALDLGRYTEEKISDRIPCLSFYGPICHPNPTDDGAEPGFAKDHDCIPESKGGEMLTPIAFFGLTSPGEQEKTTRHILNEAANEQRFKSKANRKK